MTDVTFVGFLKDFLIFAAYYAIAIVILFKVEDWQPADSFYYLSMTVSTVGYGDVAPTQSGVQLFMSAWAIAGIAAMFGLFSKYASIVQEKMEAGTRLVFRKCGVPGADDVDEKSHPLCTASPADVDGKLNYWLRYLVVLLPTIVFFGFFIVLNHAVTPDISWEEAVYFAAVTCTTIGYGDFNFLTRDWPVKYFASLYIMFFVVVFANSLSEALLIRQRQRLRNKKIAIPKAKALEEILLEKVKKQSPADVEAGVPVAIEEMDFVVHTLLAGELIDPQLLLAIRRQYYWAARVPGKEADPRKLRGSVITERDIHAQLLAEHEKKKSLRRQGSIASLIATIDPERPAVPAAYEAWLESHWKPECEKKQAEGMEERLTKSKKGIPDRRRSHVEGP